MINILFKQAVKLILVLIVLGISNAAYSQNEPKGELKKGEIAKAEIIKGTHKYKEKCIKETGNRELCECMADAIETRAHPNHVTHTDDGPTFF